MKNNLIKKIAQSSCVAILVMTTSSVVMAQPNQVSVTVKKIGDYGESGDAYVFKATSGKTYQVYNAGGASPIKGESLIQQSVKTKQQICLILDRDQSQPRLVQAVKKGPC